jgi:hypothetical protein
MSPKNLSAVPEGSNKIRVFDVDKGIRAYTISLSNCKQITSVVPSGSTCTVVYETNDRKIMSATYELNKGTVMYRNYIGAVDVPQEPLSPSFSMPSTTSTSRQQNIGASAGTVERGAAGSSESGWIVGLPLLATGLTNKYINLHSLIDSFYTLKESLSWKTIVSLLLHCWVWFGQGFWWLFSNAFILLYKILVWLFHFIHELIQSS